MKKIVLIIMVVGFALGAKAQSTSGETNEIINDCVTEKTDTTYKYKPKKHKNKMAMCMRINPGTNQSSDNNPYSFATNVSKKNDDSTIESSSLELSNLQEKVGVIITRKTVPRL